MQPALRLTRGAVGGVHPHEGRNAVQKFIVE